MRSSAQRDPRRFPGRTDAGSVILLVLVTVLLAAFMVTKFVDRAGTELLADARAGHLALLRREAYSALETTLAVLAEVRAIDQELHSPAQGWDRPLEYAGHQPGTGIVVETVIADESGKLSLPRTDAATLEALLVVLGLAPDQAERAADALLVWTRPEHLPVALELDGSNYERAPLPYHPARRPLRSFAELAAIEVVQDLFFDEQGRPNRLARDFMAHVSLYSFERVNLNAAPPAVLLTAGFPLAQVDAWSAHARRQNGTGGPAFYRSTEEAAAVLGVNGAMEKFSTRVAALRITVIVRDGASVYRLVAVVAPPGGATLAPAPTTADAKAEAAGEPAVAPIKKLDYPFKVLEIAEDVESPETAPDRPLAP